MTGEVIVVAVSVALVVVGAAAVAVANGGAGAGSTGVANTGTLDEICATSVGCEVAFSSLTDAVAGKMGGDGAGTVDGGTFASAGDDVVGGAAETGLVGCAWGIRIVAGATSRKPTLLDVGDAVTGLACGLMI